MRALLGVLVMLLCVLALHAWESARPVCGDALDAPPVRWSFRWLVCATEHQRPMRALGEADARNLHGVHAMDDGRQAWAVGQGGAIRRTADGGRSWQAQTSGSRNDLQSIHVARDGLRGWAVGDEGTVLVTADGGNRWIPVSSGASAALWSIAFDDSGRRGWAVGDDGTVLHSNDGGQHWVTQRSGTSQDLLWVSVSRDGRRAWIAGRQGVLLATSDAGQSWQSRNSGTLQDLWSLSANDDGRGLVAVGDGGVILASADEWQTVTPRHSGTGRTLLWVSFAADGKRGWAAGLDGVVLGTRDGGASWVAQESATRADLLALAVTPDGSVGWAVGSDGVIVRMAGADARWSQQAGHYAPGLQALHMLPDGQTGWAVGARGVVLATQDGGRNWSGLSTHTRVDLHALAASQDGQLLWAVGEGGTILASADAGRHWQVQQSGTTQRLLTVHFSADGERGWAAGAGGTVLATSDGGRHWALQDSPTTRQLRWIGFAADGQRGWAVGDAGTLLTSEDAGHRWVPHPDDATTAGLRAASFATDGQRGWAVGARGTIVSTRDGGRSWSARPEVGSELLVAVSTSGDGRSVQALGRDGQLIASVDGGLSWTQLRTPGGRPQVTSRGGVGSSVWAMQRDGTMLRAVAAGTDWERHVPAAYARTPAPSFWGCVAALCVAMLGLAHWGSQRPWGKAIQRVLGLAVSDAPITDDEHDDLKFAPVVRALSGFMRHHDTQPSLTVAVTADWGRGKSSLMNLLRRDMRRHGVQSVWFNAWHHQKEEVLLAALLSAIVTQALPPWLSLRGLKFRTRLVWRRWLRRRFLGAVPALLWLVLAFGPPLLAALVLLTPGVGVSTLHPAFAATMNFLLEQARHLTGNAAVEALLAGEWGKIVGAGLDALEKKPPAELLGLIGAVWVLVSLFLLCLYFCRAFPAKPAALLATLGTRFRLSAAEDQTSFRQRFRDHFRDVTRALRPHTLTIYIDDLDRCEPAKAAEMLEAVNYIVDAGDCHVVLGMAREIVEAQLGEAYGGLAQRTHEFALARAADRGDGNSRAGQVGLDFARKYLQKLIQIEFQVPPLDGDGIEKMLARSRSAGAPHPGPGGLHMLRGQKAWDRLAELGTGVLRALAVAVAAGLLCMQVPLWLEAVHSENQKDSRARRNDLDAGEDRALRDSRHYQKWLSDQLAPARQANVRPALQATASPLNIERAARLEQVEIWMRRRDALFADMRTLLRDGQNARLATLAEEAKGLEDRIMELALQDLDYGLAVLHAPRAHAPRIGTAGGPTDAPLDSLVAARRRPIGDYTLVTAGGPLLVLGTLGLLAAWAMRERRRVRDTPAFVHAQQTCAPLLRELPIFQAPREIKRLQNMLRYLVLRVLPAMAAERRGWFKRQIVGDETQLPAQLPLDEQQIVALAVLACTRSACAPQVEPLAWLRDPGRWLTQSSLKPEAMAHCRTVIRLVGTWPAESTLESFLGLCSALRGTVRPVPRRAAGVRRVA
ncbi:YCF48-related protein [Pseudorhodoferax sp.]|uniref:YCF48-related protein n=1 Tax=Pseudorhodoferax sp. TaxID=1993553 RepID=UPI002DD69DC3|nr:YCF48-related protein [Pseudorhodoferax sp.]